MNIVRSMEWYVRAAVLLSIINLLLTLKYDDIIYVYWVIITGIFSLILYLFMRDYFNKVIKEVKYSIMIDKLDKVKGKFE